MLFEDKPMTNVPKHEETVPTTEVGIMNDILGDIDRLDQKV